MALLTAGAIGNLIDRLWLGKVTDMFWIRAIDFPVFNIADSCITFAAIILGWRWARDTFSSKPEPKREEEPVKLPSEAN